MPMNLYFFIRGRGVGREDRAKANLPQPICNVSFPIFSDTISQETT